VPIAPGGLSLGASESRSRPRPVVAATLVGIGGLLLTINGIWALEAAEALFAASPPGLNFTCVGTCAATQAVVTLASAFLLFVSAWWMYRRPKYHVVEGLLVCVLAAVSEAVGGGFSGGLLIPTLVTAAGGVWALVWSPTPGGESRPRRKTATLPVTTGEGPDTRPREEETSHGRAPQLYSNPSAPSVSNGVIRPRERCAPECGGSGFLHQIRKSRLRRSSRLWIIGMDDESVGLGSGGGYSPSG